MSRKELYWLADSFEALKDMPDAVQDAMGHALDIVQQGDYPIEAKPLTGADFQGVYELVVRHNKNTYWGVCVVNIGDAIYVLHVFHKKSKQGIKTPSKEIDTILRRLRALREQVEHDR